jgi:hypothetical protein
MSDYEQHIGKLKEIEIEESLETTCKEIMENKELPSYCSSYKEFLFDEKYDDYIVADDKLYKVVESQDIESYDDIMYAEENNDGTISFVVRYYNGGSGFGDAIGEALKNLEVKNNE